ncbi:MAG TPA: hypothetical protein DCW68_02060 [Rhodospirillaceae bacterium]|nr:MAG: hypothetical protein A2018_05025 [Alphaproteobacteria bacterium GWF2_58_20]HAU28879.1 hypothetical protein [Rhodospirillaceae bacterium]
MKKNIQTTVIAIMGIFMSHSAFAQPQSTYDRVMETGAIRCGYIHYEPNTIINRQNGQISGIDHDLMEEIGKRLALRIEWTREVGFGTAIEGMTDNQYDMVCSDMWAGSARARQADFSTPLNYSLLNVWVRADDTRFDTNVALLNTADHVFSAIGEDSNIQIVKNAFPEARIMKLSSKASIEDVFNALTTKKADAVLEDDVGALAFLENHKGSIRNITKGNPVSINANVMMLPGGEYRFNQMINNAIRDIQFDGTFDKIVRKYNASESRRRIANPYEENAE